MIEEVKNKILQMFSDLNFDKQRHFYFIGTQSYPSVSSKVNSHAEKFNEKKWLRSCAPKRGLTENQLKQQWDTKRDVACERGTDTHDYLEQFDGLRHANTLQKKAGVLFLKEIISEGRYIILFKELRMYHRLYKYAGTADLILWDTWTNSLVIADYKTNEDLFKTFKWLLAPFDYLENNPYNKYQLQLSYYDIILSQVGFKVSERWIVYLKPLGGYKIHKTVDFTKQLSDLMSGVKPVTTQASWFKIGA